MCQAATSTICCISCGIGECLGENISPSANTAIITVPAIPGVNSYTLGIPATFLSVSPGKDMLVFATPQGSVTIPKDMLTGMPGTEGKQAGISIAQGDKTSLTDEEKATIGDRSQEVVLHGR